MAAYAGEAIALKTSVPEAARQAHDSAYGGLCTCEKGPSYSHGVGVICVTE